MGLFDKRDKKRGGKDDFDSPVEQIDLSKVGASPPASPPAPATPAARAPEPSLPMAASNPAPAPSTSTSTSTATATPGASAAPAAAAKPAAPAPAARLPASSSDGDDYGIERAIELMRTLPSENVELVVQVVKFSLESVGIKLPAIIEDAIRRQKDIQGRIGVLKGEIHDLESEIRQRKEEIDKLEADHRETSMVRDRLELAENLGKPAKIVSSAPSAESRPESSSQALPRVTRQTGSPPMAGQPTSTSPSSPSSSPIGSPPAGSPIKK